MAIKPGQGLAKWEIATLRKIVGVRADRTLTHPAD